MTNNDFGMLSFIGLFGPVGFLMAFFPRVIPDVINAFYESSGVKKRVAVSDSEKLYVRVFGGIFFIVAICLLITQWSNLWN